jgi:uncharacterized UPF0160 family protein
MLFLFQPFITWRNKCNIHNKTFLCCIISDVNHVFEFYFNFHQSKLNKSFSPLKTKYKSCTPLTLLTGAEKVFHAALT